LACLFSLGDFFVLAAEVFLVGVDSLAEDCMVSRVENFQIAGAKGSYAQARAGTSFHWPTHCQSETPFACHWMNFSPIHVPF